VIEVPELRSRLTGKIFSYPSHRTWEWTSSHPIRSVFPLWPTYGLPMTILTWIWAADSKGTVSPDAIYYALRMVMFILSFVLEDWAIFELVHSPVHRSVAVALVASSYVTWTFQTHTFSNSLETLLVAWSLVLIDRITSTKVGNAHPGQKKLRLQIRSNGLPLGHALFSPSSSFLASSIVLLFQPS
jgi:GPI mannosyltransferase 4